VWNFHEHQRIRREIDDKFPVTEGAFLGYEELGFHVQLLNLCLRRIAWFSYALLAHQRN